MKSRAVCRSHKLSLEPQESTNPSKLSGMQTVRTSCFELVETGKKKKKKECKSSKGHFLFFLNFYFRKEETFFLF